MKPMNNYMKATKTRQLLGLLTDCPYETDMATGIRTYQLPFGAFQITERDYILLDMTVTSYNTPPSGEKPEPDLPPASDVKVEVE